MELYHITKPEYVASIQKEGLVPNLGKNSLYVDEPTPIICLTDSKDIGLWAQILGAYDLFKVRIMHYDECKLHQRRYPGYREYLYSGDYIPPGSIEYIGKYELTPEDIYRYHWELISIVNNMATEFHQVGYANIDKE